MPNPNALYASGRYVVIDLTAASFPLDFKTLFAAKYPDEIGFQAQACSRTIVATSGSGEIEFIGTRGEETIWTMAEGEANAIQASGVSDPGDIGAIKVLL